MLTNKTVNDFLNDLASNSPAPGGGSVAALAGAMGAALASMVCNLTIGKKKYEGVETEMKSTLERTEYLRSQFTVLVDRDTEAFNKVMEAFRMPKETDNQKANRDSAIQSATKDATMVPLDVMRLCIDGLQIAKVVAEKGNTSSASDAGVSAIMLYGGLESAALNVRINLGGLKEKELIDRMNAEVLSLQKEAFPLLQTTLAVVREKMVKPG